MSLSCFAAQTKTHSTALRIIAQSDFAAWLEKQTTVIKTWLNTTGFKVKPGAWAFLPDAQAHLSQILVCIDDKPDLYALGHLPLLLPEGLYHLEDAEYPQAFDHLLGWGLGSYQFTRYKKAERAPAQIIIPKTLNKAKLNNLVSSIYTVRDLINTPTEDLGPAHLADIARNFADEYGGDFTEIVGEALLEQGYAAIHTVGRASDRAPRLIDLQFGDSLAPKVTLVGKGVCFDSGGLDLKNAEGMAMMKKDMGGAAHVLGLARMILNAKLPIYLRVLIPAVENSVSGNAYKPGDVIKTRAGITVEVGNTDAEGRLVLADSLHAAVHDKPDLLIDMATLTGAAKVGIGTEIATLFTNNDALAEQLAAHSSLTQDLLWRMPLYAPYRDLLKSQIADINNAAMGGYGGAITAALFLQEFVPSDICWAHFDLMAWNVATKPGRPIGGEAHALRALFSYLEETYDLN